MNPGSDTYLLLLPAVLMTLFGCTTLILGVFSSDSKQSRLWPVIVNGFGLVLIAYPLLVQWRQVAAGATITTSFNAMTVDGASVVANGIVWLATAILLLISYAYLERAQEHRHEYYALALFAQCGMYCMICASDLVLLFVGLELTSLSFYILVGFTRSSRRSNEAALKYLLLGALSSGFVLYGFSLLYGVAGSTALTDILAAVHTRSSHEPFVLLATVTITVGLLFKVSAAPFHTWVPDAYDGAPTPVAAYLSVASQVASFAVLIHLLWFTLAPTRDLWQPLVATSAVLSLTIGAIAAITQDRLKRLFAYSSIAHVGYLLLGLVAGTADALRGIYLYLAIYAIMNLGAFALLASLRTSGDAGEQLTELRSLSRTHPVHAALLTVLLLSLAGIPPTAGFLAKYFIFAALVQTGHIALASIAAVYVAVSLYFYFRLIREMYLSSGEPAGQVESSLGIKVVLVATAAVTLLAGLFPEPLLQAGLSLVGRQ